MSKDSLKDDLNKIINHYLVDMMNAFRSSRNAWISLEKDKNKYKTLLEKAKTSNLNELMGYFTSTSSNEGRQSNSYSFIPIKIHENDKDCLSYEETLKKVEKFIEESKSQGFNRFAIAGDYSVSLVGIESNEKRIKSTLKLPQREYIYWHCSDFFDKLHKRITHLVKMTLVYQFSFFEACLKDLLRKIYEYKPELLRSNSKNLSNKEIIDSKTREELLIKMLEREVDWWGYQSIDKIAKRIKSRFNINLERDFANWEDLREAYYIRNVIVHNSGIVNEISCNKLGYDQSRIGEKLELQTEYIEKIYTIIRENLIYIKNGLLR
ncbi:MAG TPA: hypothetical protein ENI29_21900 [bacterium]|nr:hypothetical protein [bacterium]